MTKLEIPGLVPDPPNASPALRVRGECFAPYSDFPPILNDILRSFENRDFPAYQFVKGASKPQKSVRFEKFGECFGLNSICSRTSPSGGDRVHRGQKALPTVL